MKDNEMNEKELLNTTGSEHEEDYEFVVKEGNWVYADPMKFTRYRALETVMTNNDGDPVRTEFTFHPTGSEHYTREEKTISVYWMYSYREDFGGQVG